MECKGKGKFLISKYKFQKNKNNFLSPTIYNISTGLYYLQNCFFSPKMACLIFFNHSFRRFSGAKKRKVKSPPLLISWSNFLL